MNIKLWFVLWCILDEEEVSILQVAAKAGSDVVCTNLLPADLFSNLLEDGSSGL